VIQIMFVTEIALTQIRLYVRQITILCDGGRTQDASRSGASAYI